MNKRIKDDMHEMRRHLDDARLLHVNFMFSADYYTMNGKERKAFAIAMRHLQRCDDRLFELYNRILAKT